MTDSPVVESAVQRFAAAKSQLVEYEPEVNSLLEALQLFIENTEARASLTFNLNNISAVFASNDGVIAIIRQLLVLKCPFTTEELAYYAGLSMTPGQLKLLQAKTAERVKAASDSITAVLMEQIRQKIITETQNALIQARYGQEATLSFILKNEFDFATLEFISKLGEFINAKFQHPAGELQITVRPVPVEG